MTTPSILAPQQLVKTSREELRYDFEFRKRLAAGDTFTGTPTITAIPDTELSFGTAVLSGSIVQVPIDAGVDGRDYTVSCLISTTQGDTLEMQGTLLVRDK